MKRVFTALLAAVMGISMCLPMVACADGEDHEHEVTSWTVTVAPTCTQAGTESGVCTVCGKEISREKAALGHDWQHVSYNTEPTCEAEGEEKVRCSRGDAEDVRTVPATGHTLSDRNIVKLERPASCTENGLRIVRCSVCNKEVEDAIPALGHAWKNDEVNLTEPTCTQEGTVHATCSRCGAEEVRSVPALGHDWELFYTIETPADFEHDGLKYQTCSRCDERTNETVIPKLNPNEPTQYQFRAVRASGDVVKLAGIGYEIFSEDGVSLGKGDFRNGTATAALKPATYKLKLTSLPKGYTAESEYTVSWENLVSDIRLTAKLVMEQPEASTSYAVGSVMNDLTFDTIKTNAREAESVTLAGLLATHKIVVLNFWDTSCSFCEYEFPGLEGAYERYRNDVALIAVDDPDGMGSEESESEVRAYANRMQMTFYVSIDKAGLAERFSVPTTGYPMTVVIDCEG